MTRLDGCEPLLNGIENESNDIKLVQKENPKIIEIINEYEVNKRSLKIRKPSVDGPFVARTEKKNTNTVIGNNQLLMTITTITITRAKRRIWTPAPTC